MDHGRTGTRYRFRFETPGAGRVSNVALNLVVGLLGAVAVLGLGMLFLQSLREVTARDSVFHRLLRSPTADDRARGRLWGPMTARMGDGNPLCYVEHQHYVSGKNGGWRTDSWVWFGRSVTFETPWGVYPVHLRGIVFEPLEPKVPAHVSPYLSEDTYFPPGGRIRVQCLSHGERFFGDLCIREGLVGRCADGSASVLTEGDGRPTARLRAHANTTVVGFAAALLMLLLLALYGWRTLRVGPIVGALGAWSKAPAPGSRLGTWVGIAAAVVCGLMVALIAAESASPVPYEVSGYVFGIVVLGATAVGLVLAYDRRRSVRRALDPVEAAETVRLARAGEGLAELAVRVPRDAPTVSFPGLPPCAFLSVSVGRTVIVGKSHQVVPLHAARWPTTIPVEDPSGVGMLDLTNATLDLRAVFFHRTSPEANALLRFLRDTPFGSTHVEDEVHLSLEVEVDYIEPGESLYLLGGVRRIEDPNASTHYRAMGTLPIISADGDKHLVVHAGREAGLLRTLLREHGYLTAAMGVLSMASLGLVAVCLWLVSRA